MICLCNVDIVDMNNCSNDGPTSSLIDPQPIDRVEQKRKRERERYAQMSTDKKDELQARKHSSYQQMKSVAGNECTFNKTIYINDSMGKVLLLTIIMSFYQRKLKLDVQRIDSIMPI